ncbi:MAG: hypothetical protein WC906_01600 [Parcubacteria group bacterium]
METGQEGKGGYKYNKTWRNSHRGTYQAGKNRYYARGRVFARNGGGAWTEEDECLIVATDRPCDREIAKKIGRSIDSIQVHRVAVRNRNKKIR